MIGKTLCNKPSLPQNWSATTDTPARNRALRDTQPKDSVLCTVDSLTPMAGSVELNVKVGRELKDVGNATEVSRSPKVQKAPEHHTKTTVGWTEGKEGRDPER